MKAVTKIATLVTSILLAGTATSATLDYRAEYKHKDEKYAHRIKIGGGTKISDNVSLNLGVEQKFQSYDQTKYWDQIERGDSEFSWDLKYTLDKNWYIQPGMPVTFGSDKTTYKPQLRVGYVSSFGLTTALRYRHEFQVFSDGASSKTLTNGSKLQAAGETIQQGKLTLTGAYKFSDKELQAIKLSYEINYNKNYDDVRLSDGKDSEWDAGVILGYQMGNFRPYMELWTVDYGSSEDDNRQLRTRVGIKYNF